MDAHTQLLGVVGHPVRHSLSPAFWYEALRHEGRNAVFLAFDVAPGALGVFIEGMRAGGAIGFNVTLPHKGAAYELCSLRSEEAEATEAVNVLSLEGGTVSGWNTDVYGVLAAVRELGADPAGSRVLVVGAGGAGRAAAYALSRAGADVSVANRTPGRAARAGFPVVPWQTLAEAAAEADLLVNATAVGLDGEGAVLAEGDLEAAASGRLRAVLDVVYGPDETPLVRRARAAGLAAADGLRMLVHQAAEAWRLLLGTAAPADVMHAAAARAAGRADPARHPG